MRVRLINIGVRFIFATATFCCVSANKFIKCYFCLFIVRPTYAELTTVKPGKKVLLPLKVSVPVPVRLSFSNFIITVTFSPTSDADWDWDTYLNSLVHA